MCTLVVSMHTCLDVSAVVILEKYYVQIEIVLDSNAIPITNIYYVFCLHVFNSLVSNILTILLSTKQLRRNRLSSLNCYRIIKQNYIY